MSEECSYAEPLSPFDEVDLAHRVIEAVHALGVTPTNPVAFLNRLRHIEYGYSAQTECAAVLGWLGHCVLIQELGHEHPCGLDTQEVKAPDLLAVFCRGSSTLRVLVEVKCSNTLSIPWSEKYHSALRRYGDMLRLPILLAWRSRQLREWILVDPTTTGVVTESKIHLTNAAAYNLMGVVGDFWVQPLSGLGLHVSGRLADANQSIKNVWTKNMVIEKAFIGTKTQALSDLTPSSVSLLFATASEEYCEESNGNLRSGVITQSGEESQVLSAQTLLRVLVGWGRKKHERIAWRHVIQRFSQIKSVTKMQEELSQDIGKAVRYIFHYLPKTMPTFIPPEWGTPAGLPPPKA